MGIVLISWTSNHREYNAAIAAVFNVAKELGLSASTEMSGYTLIEILDKDSELAALSKEALARLKAAHKLVRCTANE